jgi:glucan phosphoethanolaminetransferase (alkaline phosphatase superfamily)
MAARHPRLQWVWIALLAFAYFAQAAYFGVYRKYITVFDVRFFLQDPWMSLTLFAENGETLRPLIVAALGGWLLRAIMQTPAPIKRWGSWLCVALGTVLLVFISLNWYGAPAFQTAPIAYTGTLIRATDIRTGKNTTSTAQRPVVPPTTRPADAPDVVWIIGESLTTKHMQVYGYNRATTPNIQALQKAKQALAFQDALATSPRTMSSVPYILSGLQGVDPTGMIYSTPSIFNYAKSAGYHTGLITAQDFQWRNIDKLFVDKDMDHFQQGTDFSASVNVSIGADDHQMFDRGVKPFLAKATQKPEPLFLVIQMSGSHTPYAAQVPQDMKQFLPEETPISINAYDNTVWYTDKFISRLVQEVHNTRPNAWVFFTSDHGQDFGNGVQNKFHGSLTPDVIHVPLIVFAPAAQLNKLRANAAAPTAHADMFATTLDVMGVKPIAPIDGLSLLKPIPKSRMRVSTSYVKTLHNDPVAALIFGDGRRYQIQFDQGSVLLNDQKTAIPYKDLPPEIRAIFDQRLEGKR